MREFFESFKLMVLMCVGLTFFGVAAILAQAVLSH